MNLSPAITHGADPPAGAEGGLLLLLPQDSLRARNIGQGLRDILSLSPTISLHFRIQTLPPPSSAQPPP